MTTTLVPQTQASALDGAADLESVLKAIANRKTKANVPEKPSKAPKVVPVKQEAKDALLRLSDELSSTVLPSERRQLTVSEREELLRLASDAKAAEKALKAAVAAVKTAVFNDFDVKLEDIFTGDYLADKVDPNSGHYLVEQEMPIDGTGKRFARQLAQGTPSISSEDLLRLVESGKMSKKAYMRATKHVESPRKLDEEGLMAELKRDPQLLDALYDVIEPAPIVASFWVRDQKKED